MLLLGPSYGKCTRADVIRMTPESFIVGKQLPDQFIKCARIHLHLFCVLHESYRAKENKKQQNNKLHGISSFPRKERRAVSCPTFQFSYILFQQTDFVYSPVYKYDICHLLIDTGEDGPPMLCSPRAVGISCMRAK